MRIAYLISQYPAPSHTFIRREVDALRAVGIEVHTFSVRSPGAAERACVDRDELTRTYYLLEHKREMAGANLRAAVRSPLRYLQTFRDALRHRADGARAALWSVFHFAESVLLAEELDRRGITHLHNHFANSSATVGYLASRHLRLPWSLTLHGTAELDHPSRELLPEKIEHASFVACASHYVRSQAMRTVPSALWKKLFLVRCGVELERCPRRVPDRRDGRLRIVSVGRLSPEKGQLGLLEALRAALDAGVDAELSLVGDGPLREVLEQRAAAFGLGDRCRFVGRCSEDEVLRRVARADVFALSSFMEGLPVALMEAMALGVPVVAPAVAGIPELVEPGETGLLFPTGDFDALARCLVKLWRDPALGDRFAKAARARVAREFTLPSAAAPLIDLFARVHGEDPRARALEIIAEPRVTANDVQAVTEADVAVVGTVEPLEADLRP